jgi:hypothetical protein|tara:strand:- start:552 stop:773 length:222 start_codon:yes stop_codon:yes gene_type:complete
MSKSNWKERECGSLWRNDDGNKQYYSGFIEVDGKRQRIVIFRNGFKTDNSSKEADLRIYINKEVDSSAKQKVN